MKTAKKQKSLFRKSTEILFVAILIIFIVVGEEYRQSALYGVAGAWSLVNLVKYGKQWLKKTWQYFKDSFGFESDEELDSEEPGSGKPILYEDDPLRVLLRHVNHRITDKMKTCLPDASWDWDCKPTVNFLVNGGVARIKLINSKTYNFAEVRLDERAQLGFTLITAVNFESAVKEETGAETVVSDYTPDIAAWFENIGGKVIDDLISDLNSRNIRTLNILPGGELAIVSEGKDVVQGKVENLPEQNAWTKLVSYLIDERGLGASLQDGRIVLNW